jgi:hypothetical protein
MKAERLKLAGCNNVKLIESGTMKTCAAPCFLNSMIAGSLSNPQYQAEATQKKAALKGVDNGLKRLSRISVMVNTGINSPHACSQHRV